MSTSRRREDTATPATFVGRKRELADLLSLADRALENRGALALVAGEPGMGKTSVAEELAIACRERGFGIHWGSCWECEGQPSGWVWIQVLRGVLQDQPTKELVAELGAAAEHLRLLVPELPGPTAHIADDDPARARFALYDALARALTIAARRQPLLVVLDDLHWAGPHPRPAEHP
jgi:predicted ATPase